jgi:putative OPT family oligopeptide transporter
MAKEPSSPAPKGKVEPYIPASKLLPELTGPVLLLGVVLAAILAAANAYLGMVAGMTVSASVPAAVISMAVLKLLRTGNILQNNNVQTAAASGASIASGVIFTLPAMILIVHWTDIQFFETALIAAFGGTLGVLFTIPLRRAMIIDQPLQFPEGVATAEVLKVGAEGGGGGVKLLLLSGLIGAVAKVGSTGFKLWAEIVQVATWITGGPAAKAGAGGIAKGGMPFYFGINASPALISVGYIVGFNVAAVIFAGSVMNRWIAIPLFSELGDLSAVIDPKSGAPLAQALVDQSALDATDLIHKSVTRYLGVGGMLVGGLWSLFKLRASLIGGVTAGLDAYKRARSGGADAVPRTERDMPMNIILLLIGLSVVPLFFLFWRFTSSPGIGAAMAVLMVVAGFLFSAVSSYMAGLVGSSNNPISGITISTILVSAGLLFLLGLGPKAGPPAAILIGAVVCCAAAIGGDNLQDLKCGQLVGSTPWKQQTMQILGVIVAALVIAPVLNLLHEAYVIGGPKSPLQVPQAALMGTVSKGVFAGGLPWDIIGIGAAIAAVVIAIDVVLQKRGSSIRVPVMAFAVGVYLPFDLNMPIFLGGIVAWLVGRSLDRINASPERRSEVERNGFLVAAGFITGESLMGIAIAIPFAIKKSAYALAPFGKDLEELKLPGLILVGIVFALLYRWSLSTTAKR